MANKLNKTITNPNINYIYNEMDTQPNTWGNPGKNATYIQKKSYSNHIRELNKEKQDSIDLVFIDGIFRVACCLKTYLKKDRNVENFKQLEKNVEKAIDK